MACAKFQGNRFRIDGYIDEKHALLNRFWNADYDIQKRLSHSIIYRPY